MTTSFWDPGNLLQITDGLRHGQSDTVTCLGIAKYGNRCRWDVLEPNLSEVRPLLRQMSQLKPESITIETLRRLARLCLCPKYHSNQVEQVVRHWTGVLQAATQYHKNLLAGTGNPSSDEVKTLRRELASKQEECEVLKRDLNAERDSHAGLSEEWRHKSEEMRTEITHLKQQLCESEDNLKAAESARSDQEQAIQALAEKHKNESAVRNRAEVEIISLRTDLGTTKDKLKAARDENKSLGREMTSLGEELRSCRDEIDQLKATERDLTKEREDRDAMLQQCRAQLGKQLAQNTILDDRIANMEATQAHMEASIASCWVHGFWAWTTRLKNRRSRSAQLVEGKSEDIVLKTYA
ncbi:hypothetical protein ACHAPT_007410 [Fusarium lateritium]